MTKCRGKTIVFRQRGTLNNGHFFPDPERARLFYVR